MSKFKHRSKDEEIMDDLDCSGEVVHQTLREIDYINQKLGGNDVTMNGLETLLSGNTKPLIRIADIGCGGGGMLRLIAQWAAKAGLEVELIGIDANPHIVEYARQDSRGFANIEYKALDVFGEEYAELEFDLVLCTLVLHHFTEEQLSYLFQTFKKQARVGVVVNDLHRHWLAYYSIKLLTRVFSKSKMVRYDAPLSVLRGFVKSELEAILSTANINSFDLKWRWAFRWQVLIPA